MQGGAGASWADPAWLVENGGVSRFGSTILADDADENPEDLDPVAEDGLHGVVGRFEADAALIAEEALEGGLAVVVADGDDLAVVGLFLAS